MKIHLHSFTMAVFWWRDARPVCAD